MTDAVGKRAQVDLMLEVSPARLRAQGLRVFRSQNGVVLVRRAPRAETYIRITLRRAAGKINDLTGQGNRGRSFAWRIPI